MIGRADHGATGDISEPNGFCIGTQFIKFFRSNKPLHGQVITAGLQNRAYSEVKTSHGSQIFVLPSRDWYPGVATVLNIEGFLSTDGPLQKLLEEQLRVRPGILDSPMQTSKVMVVQGLQSFQTSLRVDVVVEGVTIGSVPPVVTVSSVLLPAVVELVGSAVECPLKHLLAAFTEVSSGHCSTNNPLPSP